MLEIKELSVSTEDKKILDRLTLSIDKGQIHVIMGPNGTGKSTLSKVIMGHEDYKILYGDILFNGESIKQLETDERARLGIFLAMQNPVSIEGIANSEFIKAAINARRESPIGLFEFVKKVEKVSDELGVARDNIHKNVNVGASGGERKKNEIFQMRMLEPKFIILDELDSGLDVDSLAKTCQNISDYLEENKDTSVLIITHYPRILEYLKPDYVHILKDGKIVKTGDYSLALEIEKNGYNGLDEVSVDR